MQVLKTIPGIPAIAEITDSVHRINTMNIDFVAGMVSFTVTSSYQVSFSPVNGPASRPVSFAEVAPLVTGPDVLGFVAIVRQSLALAMNVTLDKIPVDIFSV
jgi:hypothetical protein